MKQFIFFILLFSVTLAFSQTEQSATSAVKEDNQKSATAVKAQKVSEVRHVVIKGNVQMAKSVQNKMLFDEKGGIIRPNASKGIQQKQLNPQQKKLVNRVEKTKRQGIQNKTTSVRNDVILEKQTTKKPMKGSEAKKKRNE